MARIRVLNGPNLNLLGSREPAVYGSATLGAPFRHHSYLSPACTGIVVGSGVVGDGLAIARLACTAKTRADAGR